MQVFGRELTTDEIIRFVRDFAAQTLRHKDCHDCLYIDMALELADEVERLNRRAAPENKPLMCEGCVNRSGGLGYLACDGCCRKFPDRYEARRPEGTP